MEALCLNLPIEDTIWSVLQQECDSDSEDESGEPPGVLLMILDEHQSLIGARSAHQGELPAGVLKNLLQDCLIKPLSGRSRKPRFLKVPSHADSTELNQICVSLGITMLVQTQESTTPVHELIQQMRLAATPHVIVDSSCSGAATPDSKMVLPMKQCCHCHRRGSTALFDKCAVCNAVYFCSDTCCTAAGTDTSPYSHRHWCSKMAGYMSQEEQLATLPFTYTSETTDCMFSRGHYKMFLDKRGVPNKHLWMSEHESLSTQDTRHKDDVDLYNLPIATCLSSQTLSPPDVQLMNWEQYYAWRGIPLDSLLAVLLQWPLTIYHMIQQLKPAPEDVTEVFMLGVDKEIHLLSIFQELGLLLPGYHVNITMVGPSVSSKHHTKVKVMGNVKVMMLKGLYHVLDLPKPHLVLGLNAGIGAYPSWAETIIKLKLDRTPTYFTDYCLYSCEVSRMAVESLGGATLTEPCVNPFRGPVRIYCEEHDLPQYSNGFISQLLYHQ